MNAFEQILLNEKVINDNIIQLNENVKQIYDMLNTEHTPLQPTVLGDEGIENVESHKK